jgi:hypothetical protein
VRRILSAPARFRLTGMKGSGVIGDNYWTTKERWREERKRTGERESVRCTARYNHPLRIHPPIVYPESTRCRAASRRARFGAELKPEAGRTPQISIHRPLYRIEHGSLSRIECGAQRHVIVPSKTGRRQVVPLGCDTGPARWSEGHRRR